MPCKKCGGKVVARGDDDYCDRCGPQNGKTPADFDKPVQKPVEEIPNLFW